MVKDAEGSLMRSIVDKQSRDRHNQVRWHKVKVCARSSECADSLSHLVTPCAQRSCVVSFMLQVAVGVNTEKEF